MISKNRKGKSEFYDRMTVHRNRFPVNKINRCTEFQFDWYYYSTCFGQPFCLSSGMDGTACGSSILLLVAHGSSQLHKLYQCWCTAKNSWWWAERLPETCRVIIPIKLEFSASVGFIHKEKVNSLTYFPETWHNMINRKTRLHYSLEKLIKVIGYDKGQPVFSISLFQVGFRQNQY